MGGKIGRFAEYFPLYGVERGCLIGKRGDITACYSVGLPELFTLGADGYGALHSAWCRALRLLPPWTVVHKQDWFTPARIPPPRGEEAGSFLSRSHGLHFAERPYLAHRCYLYLTLTNPARLRATSLGSALCQPSPLGGAVRTPAGQGAFLEAVAQAAQILNDSGVLTVARLGADDLLGDGRGRPGLLEEYLALEVGGTLCLEDYALGRGECRVGGKHLCYHTLGDADDLPLEVGSSRRDAQLSTERSEVHLSFAAPVGLLLDCPHLYNQYLLIPEARGEIRRLEGEARRMTAFSLAGRENAINAELVQEYLDAAAAGGLPPALAHFNVLAWAESPAALAGVRNRVGSALAAMDCRPRHDTLDAARLFWAGLPGNAGDLPREEAFHTFIEVAACLLAGETHHRESLSPFGIKLCDRASGRPLHLDISDEPMRRGQITNRNLFILGPSGSGKSFFTNHLSRQFYEQGAHVLIVDVGNSYEGLCGLIRQQTRGADGVYFTYTDEQPISFNPFYTDDYVYDVEKRESLATLILTLWRGGEERVTKTELAELGTAVGQYLQRLQDDRALRPCFDTFYEYLRDEYRAALARRAIPVTREDFNIDNLLTTLAQYYRGGRYDFLLNSPGNLDLLGKRFIVFEIDAIKDNPELFPVVTIIVMETFISKMRRLKGVRKMILIEEAWKALMGTNMGGYIKYLYKTVRKHFGTAAVVTQEADDIIQSPVVKESIINNSDCMVLLDQRKYLNKFDGIQALLGLTDLARAQILSLNTRLDPARAPYREVWIGLGGTRGAVYATEVSDEEYLAYTTEAQEKLEVQALAAQRGGDLQAAIRELAQRRRDARAAQREGAGGARSEMEKPN